MFNMKSSSLCWLFLVISIHPESVKSQAILSDSTGLEGEELTLTCDLSRAVEVSPTNVYGVKSLIVSKLDPGTSTFVPQVVYSPPIGSFPILQNQMDPTYYNVHAEGLDPNNPNNYGGNQNIMKITVTFTSLRCVDRGTYKCSAEYTVQDGTIYLIQNSELTEDLKIDVQPSLITATSNPFESLGYENNQNVTFRCRFRGPPAMEVRWFYKQCQDESVFEPIIQRWTIENDIQTDTNPQDSQECATVEMDSELKNVQLNQIGINNDPGALLCWVQCQAGIIDNLFFREHVQWNMTIDYKESVKSQAILSDSTGLEGEELTLTCYFSRAVEVSPTNLYGVSSLTVSKLNPETSLFEPQVVYTVPVGPTSILQNQMDPTYYNVHAEGLDPNNPNNYGGNQNIMKITVTFTSLRCVDNGTYKCSAEYTVQDGTIYLIQNSELTDLKIDVQPSLITATSNPFESLGYENNQNVTFRCRFRGPPTMEVRWFYKQCQGDSFFEPTIQRWPFENDIETTTTPQDSQDCTTIEMDSELKNVQLNRIGINNDPGTLLCWVQCQAGIVDNLFFRELLQWNMTIDYKANKKIFTEAELVGGIIGAFVGTLMLVAVIALIVFFIRREKDKHKRRTEDTDYDIIRRQAPLPSSAIQETERRYKNQAFRDYKEPIEPDPNAYSEIQDD